MTPEEEIKKTHELLDQDPSGIIRNAKDGYPYDRPDRTLSLYERVQALCKYAADWKRWYKRMEDTYERQD